MAQSDLGKYSVTSPRFSLADKHFRASTDREESGSRRPSKIKDSSGRSGGPATRKVLGEAGTGAEASYPRYEVPTGVEAGDQEIPTGANVPQDIESQRVSTPEMTTERQGAITDRARGPYYVPGSPLDNILGHISEAQSNTAFDPDKPVGGENVPYQPTKGISGWFQRFGGNRANEQNIEAQAAQSAEWKQDATVAKERQAKLGDYRSQKAIDAEIASDAADKANAHQLSLLEKTQAAHREEREAQNAFSGAQSDKDRTSAMERLMAANANASALHAAGLAATKDNIGLQQVFQKSLADKEDETKRFIANNAVHFGSGTKFSRGGTVYDTPLVMPGQPSTTNILAGPEGEGPQVNFGGAKTPPRSGGGVLGGIFSEPAQLPPGGGVRMGGALPAPVPAPAPAPAPKPMDAAVTPPRSAEQTPEEGYSIWTGRYPGQPEPVMGRLNFETTRKFLGPLGEDISGATERFAEPVKKLDLTNPEMNYDRESYKRFLRRQMGSY